MVDTRILRDCVNLVCYEIAIRLFTTLLLNDIYILSGRIPSQHPRGVYWYSISLVLNLFESMSKKQPLKEPRVRFVLAGDRSS